MTHRDILKAFFVFHPYLTLNWNDYTICLLLLSCSQVDRLTSCEQLFQFHHQKRVVQRCAIRYQFFVQRGGTNNDRWILQFPCLVQPLPLILNLWIRLLSRVTLLFFSCIHLQMLRWQTLLLCLCSLPIVLNRHTTAIRLRQK